MDVQVPSVGESITEVTVGQWTVEDGAYVEMDQPICELESDKATFELNAEAAGVITRKAEEGDTLEVGQIICTIDTKAKKPDNGSGSKEKADADQKTEKRENQAAEEDKREEGAPGQEGKGSVQPTRTGKTIDMKIPEVGESITEVTIGTWVKQDGDLVEMDDVVAEIESDKATFELTAEGTGKLHIKVKEGETVPVGSLVCQIEEMTGTEAGSGEKAAPESTGESAQKTDAAEEVQQAGYASGHPSPAAAKILKEKSIDASDVQGTGMGGRITKEDALKAQQKQGVTAASPKDTMPMPGDAGVREQAPEPGRGEHRKRMSTLRKTIANRLVSVKNETAMLTTFNEVNMQPIMDIRKKYKEPFKEKYEVNLGFMSFFVKACCQALSEWPAVNAILDGDEIVYHDYCDVSIAVSTPRGLVVPVIRDAQKMRFDTIEKTIVELATRAREGKLSIEEMQGGTFTITNGGVFGSMLSTPIINTPQSAILGMHNIVERPVAVDGEVVIRPVMYIALSYDHRVIDGRESVSFLVRVKELLEDPSRLLLGV